MRRTLRNRLEEPPVPREPLLPRFLAASAAFAIYLLLALWALQDVLPRFGTAYAGAGELDGWLWRYWWMKQLVSGAWQQSDLGYTLHTALVSGSYPETGNVFDLQAFSWPLEALLGAPTYYNVKALLFLTLNGMAGYWLGRLLIADWTASVLCGVAFGFGSYVLLELDVARIRHAGVFPLALYAFALMRLQQNEGSIWRAAWAGAAFGLCTSVYLYYGMGALFLTLLWLIALGWPRGDNPRTRRMYVTMVTLGLLTPGVLMTMAAPPVLVMAVSGAGLATLVAYLIASGGWSRARGLSVLAVVAVLTSLPYATWYLEQALVHQQPLREVSYFRDFPPLESLLNPHDVHTSTDNLMNSMVRFRGDSTSWDYPWLWGYRRATPLVFTLLVAGGLLLLKRRPWLWVSVALLGYVLSLGPYLKQGTGEIYVQSLGTWSISEGIRLPHTLFFKYVPYFSRLFSPIRMQSLYLLGLGVLVGWTVAAAFQRLRMPTALRPLALPIVLGVLLLQWRSSDLVPIRYSPLSVPDVYTWIATQNSDGIVELPFREGDYINYYQIFHGKRVLEGWAAGSLPPGFPAGATRWLGETSDRELPGNPFVRWLRELNGAGPGRELPKAWTASDVESVQALGYRYLVLHERGCYLVKGEGGSMHYQWMRKTLEDHFGPPVRESQELVREAPTGGSQPHDGGLYPHEIVVFDMQSPVPTRR